MERCAAARELRGLPELVPVRAAQSGGAHDARLVRGQRPAASLRFRFVWCFEARQAGNIVRILSLSDGGVQGRADFVWRGEIDGNHVALRRRPEKRRHKHRVGRKANVAMEAVPFLNLSQW